jgi:hypothetical protein
MSITPYQMCINNAVRYIHDTANTEDCIDVFTFSSVLSACFCKSKEEVADDIIKESFKNIKKEIETLKNL